MIGIEQVLLMSTGVSFVVLIVLLFFSSKKNHKIKENKYLSKDLIKIKEKVSED
ncbi:MAG: hypothetical protein AABX23_03860 [Nanoarchaeota archaeon]